MEHHRQSLLLKITPVVVEDEDGDVQKDGGMISPEIVNSAPFYLPSSSSSHHGYYLHQLNRSTDSEGNQGTSNGDRHQMMSLRNQNVSQPLSEPESLNQTNNNTQNVKTKEGFDRLNTTGSSKLAGAVRTIRLITRIVMVRLKGFFSNDKDVDDFLISSGQGLDRTFVDSITDVRGRYCRKCRLVKPLRSHHCRHCGKCVLKMDHHCPWVGRCVGARNFKFFFNFLQWAFLYCSYVFATVLAVNIRNQTSSSSPSERLSLDGQHVSILVLSGLFMTFTISLLVTHFFLMSFNLSTIEHMNLTRNKKREERRIESFLRIELDRQREHNQKDDDEKRKDKRKWFWRQDGDVNLLRQFFKVRKARRIIVRRFDREWGSPLREANPFSRGSWKKNFEEIMGLSKAAWILPIRGKWREGSGEAEVGLKYELNSRFDEDGRIRRRVDWPSTST
ncbi:DHHC palmitoyltransferase-domain-containing protein [Phakopsora pachyrhizi]|nr:DHHC palmitoyltransferase-domain-containing protein [Phakopsora pachyrhizi]